MRVRSRRISLLAALSAAVLLSVPATSGITARAVTGLDATTSAFCQRAQKVVAATDLEAQNIVHADYRSFTEARPRIAPLETQQYVLYEDDSRTVPLRVSCKMKTADHLEDEYGEEVVSSEEMTCADLQREMLTQVYAGLSEEQRALLRRTPDQIIIDPDQTSLTHTTWVAPYDFAYIGEEGALHLRAKALRIGWDDFLWSWAPGRMRGRHYCHVIAPEYLRRLMIGDSMLPQMPPAKSEAGR